MKRISTLVVILLLSNSLIAQPGTDPKFSLFMFNKLPINPGVAGDHDGICATILHRSQWIGFGGEAGGEPVTQALSVHSPVPSLHGGIGLTIIRDAIGFDDALNAKLNYSYRFNTGAGLLGIGIQAGMFQKSMNGALAKGGDAQNLDAAIPTGLVKGIVPDFGLGLYYNTDNLYFGISSIHLIESELKYTNSNGTAYIMPLTRHFYILAGYDYDLGPKLTLSPSILVKSVGAPATQLDVNTNIIYKKNKREYWAGVTYSSGDLVHNSAFIVAQIGMDITKQLMFGYSYDVTTTDVNTYSPQTHEILLNYCFKVASKVKPIHIIRTPRFL